MAFTAPRTWQVGDEATAALLNGISSQISQLQAALTTQTYTPTLTASTTNPTLYAAGGLYIKAGNLVWYWFNINISSGSAGSGYYQVSLPVAADSSITNQSFTPSGTGFVTSSGFSAVLGQWDVYTATTAILRVPSATTTIENVTSAAPLSLSSGGVIGGTIIYPSAS